MRKLFALSVLSVLLSGCIAMQEPEDITKKTESAIDTISKLQDAPRILVSDKPYVDPTPVLMNSDKHKWLKKIKVEIEELPNAGSIPLSEIIRQLKTAKINVASSLPLDMFQYNGFSISETDALTALEVITSSVGLDFIVYDGNETVEPYVRIIPMQISEYTMNIGNRTLSFSNKIEGLGEQNLIADSLGGQGGSGQGSSNQSSGESSGSEETESEVSYEESIWEELEKEIDQMLLVKVPVKKEPLPQTNDLAVIRMHQQSNPNSGAFFRDVKIGRYTINKASGHVTVQAPKHIRNRIISYIEDLDKKYSTSIEIEGQIVVVAESENETKGIDMSGFVEFANDEYGLALSNDVFGGVSVSMPTQPGEYFSAAAEGTSTLAGVVAADGLLKVFSAYVQSTNSAKTLLRPEISTTSGMIGQFSNTQTVLLENFRTNTNSTESGSTTNTDNQLIPIDFGTTLKVFPRYDAEKDIIRAQIDLKQVLQNGTGTIEQIVNSENGIERIISDYPIQERVSIQGEVVGRNGSLVIMGGQEIVGYNTGDSGATGLKDSYVGAMFGNSNKTVERRKYYLVLQLKAKTHAETKARSLGY